MHPYFVLGDEDKHRLKNIISPVSKARINNEGRYTSNLREACNNPRQKQYVKIKGSIPRMLGSSSDARKKS